MLPPNFSALSMLPFFTVEHFPGLGDIYRCVVTTLAFLTDRRIDTMEDIFSAMMSGDSPNSHGKDFFDFKEGRSTPPPTTSKDIAVQSSSGVTDPKTELVAASVLAEPLKEHGPGTNFVGVLEGHSVKNEDEILATEDKPLKSDDRPDGGDKHDKKDGPKKINGTIDKLDGQWVTSPEMKKEDEEQDDSCTVKCLYYTLQCCECTVM